ncbi:MAG: 3-phosphoshikimate 1-carboxyvinyltransferase [Steroidobacteraceae bacterium]
MSAATPARRTLRYIVQPARRIGGELAVPGDKSISHRALMLGGIADGPTMITGFLASEDCLATLAALQQLGVRIERDGANVTVHGVGTDGLRAPRAPLHMGNAGTAMRLSMGLLAAQRFDSTLIGDESLTRRPMERVAAPLRLMGADIETHDGCPPVEIRGGRPLMAIDYTLPVASAQVKSALLLAALQARGLTRVTEPGVSRDHTERMLGMFGARLARERCTVALEGGQSLRGTALRVPGDFSSAAFFLVAGCLGATEGLMLRGVGVNPTRAGLIELLKKMGADIRIAMTESLGEPVADIEVRASRLRGIEVPRSIVPNVIDELPVFFIAAACADGESLVRGAEELRLKESDRLAAMSAGLARLGVEHELLADGMRIRGRSEAFTGGTIDSHGDHRIAMAFAVASLRTGAPIEIEDVANVATSFPTFVELSQRAGLPLSLKAEG